MAPVQEQVRPRREAANAGRWGQIQNLIARDADARGWLESNFW